MIEFSNEVRPHSALVVGRRRPPTRGVAEPGQQMASGHGEQGRRWQLRVPTAEDEREHNPVTGVIHNVHRIKLPLPRIPTPFYRHLFLKAKGALTITRIYLNLPLRGGPNLPLLTSIEMTPDASAVVTFHRIHWKGSPEYAPARC